MGKNQKFETSNVKNVKNEGNSKGVAPAQKGKEQNSRAPKGKR